MSIGRLSVPFIRRQTATCHALGLWPTGRFPTPRIIAPGISLKLRHLSEMCVTVSQLFDWHTELIQERQLKVREWCMFRIDKVATALQRAGSAAHRDRWQRPVRVPVAVTDAGSKKRNDMIQQ
jgi:hypothetical protein